MEIEFELERLDCPSCGLITYLPKNFVDLKRKSGEQFFCPNKHVIFFPKLQDSVESLRTKVTTLEEENKKLRQENISLIHKVDQMEAKTSYKKEC